MRAAPAGTAPDPLTPRDNDNERDSDPEMPTATSASPAASAAGSRRSRHRERLAPFWERGYKSHGYWLGKVRIGTIVVEPGRHLEMKYHWQAANHAGQTTTLKDAKRMVEQTILQGGRQLQLFDDEVLTLSPSRA